MKIFLGFNWAVEVTKEIIRRLYRYAPREADGFLKDVYIPWSRDHSLLKERLDSWCRRWKIASSWGCCAGKLLLYAFDSYTRVCISNQALSQGEARFVAAISASKVHHFRWAIQCMIAGRSNTYVSANPGPMFGRRGRKPESYTKVSPKAVRVAVRRLLTNAGLGTPRPRLRGRPRKSTDRNGVGGEQGFINQLEREAERSPYLIFPWRFGMASAPEYDINESSRVLIPLFSREFLSWE